MPELPNARHETFARCIVQGMTGSRAYIAAGFRARGNSAEAAASRLLRNVQVASRIRELQMAGTELTVLTVQWVVERLMQMADGTVANATGASDPVPMSVRRQALRDLGEHLAMFKQVQVTSADEQATALAKMVGISIDEARAAIADAERFLNANGG